MKKLWLSLLCLGMLVGCSSTSDEPKNDEPKNDGQKQEEVVKEPETKEPETTPEPVEEVEPEFDWNETLSKYNFTDEQIANTKEIMNNVGVKELDLLPNNYEDCSTGMCAFRSKAFDSMNLQINFTFEDGNLFYVQLAGIPTTKEILDTNWFGKIKTKTVNDIASCDLYYDVEGGYLHYVDDSVPNLKILPYSEKE